MNYEVACEKGIYLKLVHARALGALRRAAALDRFDAIVVGKAPRPRLKKGGLSFGALAVHVCLGKPVTAEVPNARRFGVVASAETPIPADPRVGSFREREAARARPRRLARRHELRELLLALLVDYQIAIQHAQRFWYGRGRGWRSDGRRGRRRGHAVLVLVDLFDQRRRGPIVEQELDELDQLGNLRDVLSRHAELLELVLQHPVELVIFQKHLRIEAVCLYQGNAWIHTNPKCEVHFDAQLLGHDAARLHELLEEILAAVGLDDDDHALRFELDAGHDLSRHDRTTASFVELQEGRPFSGSGERALGVLVVHKEIDFAVGDVVRRELGRRVVLAEVRTAQLCEMNRLNKGLV